MKNILLIALLLTLVSISNAQNTMPIDEWKKLVVENDSLKKVLGLLNKNDSTLNESINQLNLSLSSEKGKYEKTIDDFRKEKSRYDEELKTRKEIIASLESNKVNSDRIKLKEEVDSLSKRTVELNQALADKEKEITENKKLCEKEKVNGVEAAKVEVKKQLANYYNFDFDKLVLTVNKEILNRDKAIIGYDSQFRKVHENLYLYFTAREVLSEAYSEQKVKTSLVQIESLDQTELVTKLKENIRKYKSNNDALKEAIINIQEIDKVTIAVDDFSRKKKLGYIMYEFSSIIYDHRFNFNDYPYLADIILKIIDLKHKDPNKDISSFIYKL